MDNFYEIKITAIADLIRASSQVYVCNKMIPKLAKSLMNFPKSINDEVFWRASKIGDSPNASLRLFCRDKLGHVEIEVYMVIDDGASYDKHNCCFYVGTEAGLINRFGKALISFDKSDVGTTVSLNDI